jgi:hypothetical protein
LYPYQEATLFSDPRFVYGCSVASEAGGNECFFHTDVWASGAYWRDRRPDTTTIEVHACDASAEVAGFEVAVGLINLRGCLRGVRPPITTTHAFTHLAKTSFSALGAKC